MGAWGWGARQWVSHRLLHSLAGVAQQNVMFMDTIMVPVFFLRSFPCWFFSLQLADPHSCCKPPSPLPSLALTLPFSKYFSNICYIPGSKHIFFLFYKDPLLCFFFFSEFPDILSLENPGCNIFWAGWLIKGIHFYHLSGNIVAEYPVGEIQERDWYWRGKRQCPDDQFSFLILIRESQCLSRNNYTSSLHAGRGTSNPCCIVQNSSWCYFEN